MWPSTRKPSMILLRRKTNDFWVKAIVTKYDNSAHPGETLKSVAPVVFEIWAKVHTGCPLHKYVIKVNELIEMGVSIKYATPPTTLLALVLARFASNGCQSWQRRRNKGFRPILRQEYSSKRRSASFWAIQSNLNYPNPFGHPRNRCRSDK